jgi:cell fate (sporulation/competence/biofilm development) regulator YlbF (YheA/YmcA/DUF963 family)
MAENQALTHDTADHNGSINIASKAEELLAAMKSSNEYQEYIAAYNNMTHEETKKLRTFKQNESRMSSQSRVSFDEEKRISHLHTVLTLNRNIKTFIEKEREVCSMLTEAVEVICNLELFTFDS